jgi:guanylate kinase
LNLKKQLGGEAMGIFIQPPSVDALRERLIGRATDSMEKIEERVAKAEYELTFAERFDQVVVNDRLEEAFQEAEQIVREFLIK